MTKNTREQRAYGANENEKKGAGAWQCERGALLGCDVVAPLACLLACLAENYAIRVGSTGTAAAPDYLPSPGTPAASISNGQIFLYSST